MDRASNADIIRAGYDTFNRGDWHAVPAFFHPEAVLDASVSFVGPISYEGEHGVERFLDSIGDRFEALTCEPREIVEAGDHVMSVVRLAGRAPLTGRVAESWEVHCWTLREGRITTLRVFRDRAEAEQAIGLRPV